MHESFECDWSLRHVRPRGQIQVNQISITESKSPCVADDITLIIVLHGGTQKETSWSSLFPVKGNSQRQCIICGEPVLKEVVKTVIVRPL